MPTATTPAETQLLTKLRIEDLDDGTVHETTWAEFARDNAEDEELLEMVGSLKPLDRAIAGGGASPRVAITLAPSDLPTLTLRFNALCDDRGISRWSLEEVKDHLEQAHLRHQVHAWLPSLTRKSLVGCGVDAPSALVDAIHSLDDIIAEETAVAS